MLLYVLFILTGVKKKSPILYWLGYNKGYRHAKQDRFIIPEKYLIHICVRFLCLLYGSFTPILWVYCAFWVSCSRNSSSDGWRLPSWYVVAASKSQGHLSILGKTADNPTKLPRMHGYAGPLWTNSTCALVLYCNSFPCQEWAFQAWGHKDKVCYSRDCPVITKALNLGVGETFTTSAVKRLNIQHLY